MPSITNAHTHLELGWLSSYRKSKARTSFGSWIGGIAGQKMLLGETWHARRVESVVQGISQLKQCGTTDITDITGTDGVSFHPLLRSGLNAIVYLEVKGVLPEFRYKFEDVRDSITRLRKYENNRVRLGVSIQSIYAIHPAILYDVLEFARKEMLPLCIHADESPAEVEFSLFGTGEIVTEYIRKFGNLTPTFPGKSVVKYLHETGALELKPLLIHCVQTPYEDIELIRDNNCIVVHCPRSNSYLNCGRMQLEAFLEKGVKVLLGTDSLASAPSLCVTEEANYAIDLHRNFVKRDAITAMLSTPVSEIVGNI